ncbi:MAG: hypothetical protein N2512_07405 [Armatimonadetes bacterium]|nr:hypothetical protein [Armatimonadota bacterium]
MSKAKMIWSAALVVFYSAVGLLAVAWAGDTTATWPRYRGAWFDIKYPPGFRIVPREPSRSGPAGTYDGVSFISPDGLCEFYVYSPQWSGESKWTAQRPGEKTVSNKWETSARRKVHWVTLRGPSGKYSRSYVDTWDLLCGTRLVFGIKYASDKIYQKYRPRYLLFKKTLTQYAD